MRRVIVVSIAVLAAAVAAALALPVQQPPVAVTADDDIAISLLCQSFKAASAEVTVAAASTGEGLRTASLSRPDRVDEPGGVAVLRDRAEPVVVTVPRSAASGGVSVVAAQAGPERGLSAATCLAPVTEQWFAGVLANPSAQAQLVLANLDSTEAAVDVTVYGRSGRLSVAGSRGIVVAGNSLTTVSLAAAIAASDAVTLHVASSQGRVSAALRQRSWEGTTPLGAEWLPTAVAPARSLVIPGIPAGPGSRELVITNPGDRTASVNVDLLGTSGRSDIAGLEEVEVPAGATRTFDLTNGLAEQPGGLRLTSQWPITAGIRGNSATEPAQRDPFLLAALEPVGSDGQWPVPVGRQAGVEVLLSNPDTADARVAVGSGAGPADEVVVPAGGSVVVPVRAAATPLVRVKGAGTQVRAAVVASRMVGDVRGLAVVPLVALASPAEGLPIVYDPRTGA
ncbi:MAG: hypothetical protein IPO80_01295 [Propionibacteriaceae bacterium]|nr:hypothetical protein [Propionibacteriaceae bacterium]